MHSLAQCVILRYAVPVVQPLLRILLACLLTVCSPAWCACAFAQTERTSDVQAVEMAHADTCCPSTPADETGQDEDGMPCRDRSDCQCCDSVIGVAAANIKDITGTSSTLWLTPALVPACIASISLADSPAGSSGAAFIDTGAPPLLPAENSSLLARRCLLLI